jgi:diazepam-binding inhibitor (GABA receptor modulating acyl-CoA-binding protein)
MEETFNYSIDLVKMISDKLNNDELISVYKYYKQAKFGDINIKKPFIFNLKENTKWEAWNSVKGLSKCKAMEEYVNLSLELYEKYKVI